MVFDEFTFDLFPFSDRRVDKNILGDTLNETMANAFRVFAERRCIGVRKVVDGIMDQDYTWVMY